MDKVDLLPEGIGKTYDANREWTIYGDANVIAILPREKVEEEKIKEIAKNTERDEIERISLTCNNKKNLNEKLIRLSERLSIKYDYTIDVEIALRNLWNLQKTNLAKPKHIYYFKQNYPILVDCNNFYMLQAPRITGE